MVKGRMTTDEVFNVTPSFDDVIERATFSSSWANRKICSG